MPNPAKLKKPAKRAEVLTLEVVDDRDILGLIRQIRPGISFARFEHLTRNFPFSPGDWSRFLHLSERTLQRYKKEKKKFDALYAEKIMELLLLRHYGSEVFGNNDKFFAWLGTRNIALGGLVPKDLLDNSFGISLLKDELTRIEQGILA